MEELKIEDLDNVRLLEEYEKALKYEMMGCLVFDLDRPTYKSADLGSEIVSRMTGEIWT